MDSRSGTPAPLPPPPPQPMSPLLLLPSVALERRNLVLRCRPRTMYIAWAVAIACVALAAGAVYQRPAWQAKAYVRFKRLVLGWGIAELAGIGNPNLEQVINRKGLNVPTDDLAGRRPVSMPMGPEVVLDYIGEAFYRLYLTADSDRDEYLDPVEFGRLLDKIGPVRNFNNPGDTAAPPALPALTVGGSGGPSVDGDDATMVQLQCEFDPLHLDTITKDLRPGIGTNLHYMAALLNWTQPHHCPLTLPASLLIAGLRPPPGQPLGRPYYLTKRPADAAQSALWIRDDFDYETAHSLNRYSPPAYGQSPGGRAIRGLLSAFHAAAFASTRHPPHSSVAVVRAVGANFVDVAFRLHGEFQLAAPPAHPFWFTPSYWFGHAVFSRDFSRLLLLDMDLPADKRLNVDMEWLQAGMSGAPDEQIVEVDIGYSAAMRLCTPAGAACDRPPKSFGQYELQQPGPAESPAHELSFERAHALLEVELYPFKRVPYLPYVDAFRLARRNNNSSGEGDGEGEGKGGGPSLVHSVVLWGSLDDQSC